ncbi:MAG: hypothetical protein ACP5JF_08215 [Candidatus Methanodesulfokora sp.]|jgi:hypothetical protein
MEAIKSYRIPVGAPKDLIDFEMKRRALDMLLAHVKVSEKALKLRAEDRRKEMSC